jgi:hypothetical protein
MQLDLFTTKAQRHQEKKTYFLLRDSYFPTSCPCALVVGLEAQGRAQIVMMQCRLLSVIELLDAN